MSTSHTRESKGFTLIETMIAVSILALSVAGPLYTASRAFISAETAHDQLVASYLAQESIEYVHAMRDNDYLAAYQAGGTNISGTAWSTFLSGSAAGSVTQCRTSACTLDPTRIMGTGSGFSLQPCSGATCTPLYLAGGIYTQQSGIIGAVRTPFTRTLQVIDISSTEVRVVSTVSWSFRGIPYSVSATSHLTSWQ
jgi:prepilin-type N-terminal cleavage/methylation domain-containing protein